MSRRRKAMRNNNQSFDSIRVTMPSSIRLGCRVSGRVGPLQPISDDRIASQGGGKLRRQRSRFYGTVIRSVEGRMWTVLWDSIQKCSDHSFNSLRFERRLGKQKIFLMT
jgi:hypothetical protein